MFDLSAAQAYNKHYWRILHRLLDEAGILESAKQQSPERRKQIHLTDGIVPGVDEYWTKYEDTFVGLQLKLHLKVCRNNNFRVWALSNPIAINRVRFRAATWCYVGRDGLVIWDQTPIQVGRAAKRPFYQYVGGWDNPEALNKFVKRVAPWLRKAFFGCVAAHAEKAYGTHKACEGCPQQLTCLARER